MKTEITLTLQTSKHRRKKANDLPTWQLRGRARCKIQTSCLLLLLPGKAGVLLLRLCSQQS